MANDSPTALLLAWGQGSEEAFARLVPLVHAELRRRARLYLSRERQGHTLQPTALVNEAFVRLIDARHVAWQNRAHFFALAARMMRRILVDHARARANGRRGGGARRVSLEEVGEVAQPAGLDALDLVALDAAVRKLEQEHPRKGRVVELRYFGGLNTEEAAEALRVSVDTVKRDWRFAKLWLKHEMNMGSSPPHGDFRG